MITAKLQEMIATSMKAHDDLRLSTLRLLSSALSYEKIEKRRDLTEEEELDVVRKQAKQRRDSIEAYKNAGASDLADKEDKELKILQEFLPPEMSDEDLIKLVQTSIDETGAKTMADLGKVIGLVKSKAPSVEGGRIAGIVKSKLNG